MNRALAFLILSLFTFQAVAVVGGEIVEWGRTEESWSGVVAILPERGGVFSGVLIDEHHLLTAAHVVYRERLTPERIRLRFNLAQDEFAVRAAEAIFIHPGYRSGTTPGVAQFGLHDDLAVVRVAGSIPVQAHPYPFSAKNVASGMEFSFAGYGADADPATGAIRAAPNPGLLRLGRNRIERLLPDREGDNPFEVVLFNFDPPPPRSPVFRSTPQASRWVPGEAQLAYGDSGGPFFLEREGRLEVFAIAAFNGGTPVNCGTNRDDKPIDCGKTRHGAFGGATLVAPRLDWIRAVQTGLVDTTH